MHYIKYKLGRIKVISAFNSLLINIYHNLFKFHFFLNDSLNGFYSPESFVERKEITSKS